MEGAYTKEVFHNPADFEYLAFRLEGLIWRIYELENGRDSYCDEICMYLGKLMEDFILY